MNKEIILKELNYKTSRSSGPGGQHVNKVATKVILQFEPADSQGLTIKEKELLFSKLGNRINKEGLLILSADDSRSQVRNKTLVTLRFFELLEKAFIVPKKRKKTSPTRKAVEKRLNTKRKTSEKKESRKKPEL